MSRNIVITGVSSGLGAALNRALWQFGDYITGIDKKTPNADDWNRGLVIIADLTCESQLKAAARKVLDKIHHPDGLDVLINCAGESLISYIDDTKTEDWDRIMNINSRVPFLLVRELLPALIESQGVVVNICSDAATKPMTASLAYCASKAALEQMTRVMARELTRGYGVTVFGVSPSKIAGTAMSSYVDKRVAEVRGWSRTYTEEYHRKNVLMNEDIDVEVLARFIAHLLADRSAWAALSGCILPYGG